MIVPRLAAAALVLMMSATMLLADPVGSYRVEGTNPGGAGTYEGTVSVERTGETYRVVWVVGGAEFVGTGIGAADFIAVSYGAEGRTGLALYARDASGGWNGVWVYGGGRRLGTETWRPQ